MPHEDVAADERRQILALALRTWRTTEPGSDQRAALRHCISTWRSHVDFRLRPSYVPHTAEDQARLQRELPPPYRALRLRYRGAQLVSVRPVSGALGWSPAPMHRPRPVRVSRARRRVTRSRARAPSSRLADDDEDLVEVDFGPLTAHELDEAIDLHDTLVAVVQELSELDPDLVDVALTLSRGLVADLEDVLGSAADRGER